MPIILAPIPNPAPKIWNYDKSQIVVFVLISKVARPPTHDLIFVNICYESYGL